MRTVGDRPTLLQRFPNGVAGPVVLPEADPRLGAPTGCRPPSWRTPNGTTSRAIVMADIAHVLWAANLGASGSTRGRAGPATRRTPTSCASTSTPRPASTSRWCGRPPPRCARCSRARHHGVPQDDRQPRAPRVRARRAGLGLRSASARPPSPSPGRWSGAPGPDHRGVVEGGARRRGCSSTSTRTRRTRPCSGRGACGPARAPRCRPRSVGRAADIHPDELTMATVPPRLAADGRPVGDDRRRAAVDRAAGRALPRRPRRRHPRRAVAAGVPEDARRGTPGPAEPRPQTGVTGAAPGLCQRVRALGSHTLTQTEGKADGVHVDRPGDGSRMGPRRLPRCGALRGHRDAGVRGLGAS